MNPLVAFKIQGATHVAVCEDWSVYLIGTMNDDCSMNVMGQMVYDETVIHRETKRVDVKDWPWLRPIDYFIPEVLEP